MAVAGRLRLLPDHRLVGQRRKLEYGFQRLGGCWKLERHGSRFLVRRVIGGLELRWWRHGHTLACGFCQFVEWKHRAWKSAGDNWLPIDPDFSSRTHNACLGWFRRFGLDVVPSSAEVSQVCSQTAPLRDAGAGFFLSCRCFSTTDKHGFTQINPPFWSATTRRVET